jgi:hypothetical protein
MCIPEPQFLSGRIVTGCSSHLAFAAHCHDVSTLVSQELLLTSSPTAYGMVSYGHSRKAFRSSFSVVSSLASLLRIPASKVVLRQPAATGNAKLGRFLSELSLEKLVLKDIALGNF